MVLVFEATLVHDHTLGRLHLGGIPRRGQRPAIVP